jgi:hypothetical protein
MALAGRVVTMDASDTVISEGVAPRPVPREPTTHPAVAPISLAVARDTLRDGLARIQDLARDLERQEQAPAFERAATEAARGVVWSPLTRFSTTSRDTNPFAVVAGALVPVRENQLLLSLALSRRGSDR